MVQKSRGPRARTRYKMRVKRHVTPNDFLRTFELGQTVNIVMQPNVKNQGYPYVQFHGRTGKVVAQRGRAYVVQIHDGNAVKKVILESVHLRPEKAKIE